MKQSFSQLQALTSQPLALLSNGKVVLASSVNVFSDYVLVNGQVSNTPIKKNFGTKLVGDIIGNDDVKVTLKNSYDEAQGNDDEGLIIYHDSENPAVSVVNEDGTRGTKPQVALGHELIHVKHVIDGSAKKNSKEVNVKDPDRQNRKRTLTKDEIRTRKEENKIRQEQGEKIEHNQQFFNKKIMKYIVAVLFSFFFFYGCKDPKNKKSEIRSLRQPVSTLISSKDTLLKMFYDKEFLKALDTIEQKGKEQPIELSLIEYYAGSTYTVSHTKMLLTKYIDVGYVYFFKLDPNNKWQVLLFKEVSAGKIDIFENSIKEAIIKDQTQLTRDPMTYRAGDFARYAYKSSTNKDISEDILEKPGYFLFDVLQDIISKR